MTVGERLKARRKELGLSAEKVAEKLGLSPSTIYRYENGEINQMGIDKLGPIAEAVRTTPAYLMGWEDDPENKRSSLPSNSIPYNSAHKAPILGSIPAGYPVLALEDIEGYADIPYSDEENYFFLRVSGESMKNAGIHTGDLVLIRHQCCAEDGQVVAARVNGDESTLKRYKRQGDSVLLLPENPEYEPRIVPARDFETGDAQIIGVALEVRHSL